MGWIVEELDTRPYHFRVARCMGSGAWCKRSMSCQRKKINSGLSLNEDSVTESNHYFASLRRDNNNNNNMNIVKKFLRHIYSPCSAEAGIWYMSDLVWLAPKSCEPTAIAVQRCHQLSWFKKSSLSSTDSKRLFNSYDSTQLATWGFIWSNKRMLFYIRVFTLIGNLIIGKIWDISIKQVLESKRKWSGRSDHQ